jgi:hypothetical protein
MKSLRVKPNNPAKDQNTPRNNKVKGDVLDPVAAALPDTA